MVVCRERLVGVVKNVFRWSLGKASSNFQELETLLVECESVVNAYPLINVSSEQVELAPLTPNMLLKISVGNNHWIIDGSIDKK